MFGKMDVGKLEKMLEKHLSEELLRLEEIKNGSEVVTYLPNHIYVEPTNICNLRCATCTPTKIKGRPGKLSMEIWRDIINYFVEVGAKPTITLIGRGEPLVHPLIDEVVKYAADSGFSCYIITNGSLLTTEKAKKLIDAGLKRIQFSLHATTAETYKKMTGKACFEKVLENIKNFQLINDAAGHPCHVSVFSVLSSINEHEVEEFKKTWEGKVDRVHTHGMFSLFGDSLLANEVEQKDSDFVDNGVGGCSVPWRFFTIRWDGAIVPCALDHASRIVIENIYNKEGKIDLKAAWNSDIYKKLRKDEDQEDYDALKKMGYDCKHCGARTSTESFNSRKCYIDGFAKFYSLQFSPMIKDVLGSSH